MIPRQRLSYPGRTLIGAAAVVSLAATARAAAPEVEPQTQEPAISTLLGPLAAEAPRSEVLVLGTVHLAQLKARPRPEALERLHALLARFGPTVICVEHLSGHDISAMDALGGTYRQVAEMFAKDDLRYGKLLRRRLGCSREQAVLRATELLAHAPNLGPLSRARLVAFLLAAYDVPSALLQWSYLPDAVRAKTGTLPARVKQFLDESLASPNETSALAVPLGREVKLQRLAPVDSQWDGARLLLEPAPKLEEAFGHPLRKAIAAEGVYTDKDRRTEAAIRAGDLLPLYLHINSPEFAAMDVVAQWGPWLRMNLASGLDRYRYGNWEARNMHVVANIVDAAASPRAERVLVVIGVAHKPYLEDVLRRLASVKIVQLRGLAGSSG